MKKVLLTGGAGFIGSHIADLLINRGYSLAIVDNLSTGKAEYLNPKAIFYKRDITENLTDIFEKEKPDFLIHTAAQVMLRKSFQDPMHDAKTNILGTINILEECKKHNVKKIIYTSTGGARVGEPIYLPVDEKHPINPCSPYGISKHTAEHYVQMFSQINNMDYLIFCFGNVYGPRDDPQCGRVASVFLDKILKNQSPIIFGDGTQTRDFIYVLDIAEFIVDSLEKSPKTKLFHLANGEEVSINDVFNILKNLTNFQGNPTHIPAIKGEVKNIVLDTYKAKEELNWFPKHSIEQGLKETFDWFKANIV